MNENKWHLLLLCSCLSPDESPERLERLERSLSSEEVSWETMAQLGSAHLVLPTMWSSLSSKGLTTCLPVDFRQFIEFVHRCNLERNLSLRRQAESVVRNLNSIGIEPILLKGAAMLFTDLRDDPGSRMMTDLDVLVTPESLNSARRCIEHMGYGVESPGQTPEGHIHLDPLVHPEECAALELHFGLHGLSHPAWTNEREIWEQSRVIQLNRFRFRMLSPCHELAFNVFHSEINHGCFFRSQLLLKDLLDFCRSLTKGVSEQDWAHVRTIYDGCGLGDVLDYYLFKAVRLFGLSSRLPLNVVPDFETRFERCFSGVPWDELSTLQRAVMNVREVFSARRIRVRSQCRNSWPHLMWYRLWYGMKLARKFFLGGSPSVLLRLLTGHHSQRHEIISGSTVKSE
jgi:hypothetical protein